MGNCHRSSDGQEHKHIQHAGPERDTILHLHAQRMDSEASTVTTSGSFIGAGDFVLQLIRHKSLQDKQLES